MKPVAYIFALVSLLSSAFASKRGASSLPGSTKSSPAKRSRTQQPYEELIPDDGSVRPTYDQTYLNSMSHLLNTSRRTTRSQVAAAPNSSSSRSSSGSRSESLGVPRQSGPSRTNPKKLRLNIIIPKGASNFEEAKKPEEAKTAPNLKIKIKVLGSAATVNEEREVKCDGVVARKFPRPEIVEYLDRLEVAAESEEAGLKEEAQQETPQEPECSSSDEISEGKETEEASFPQCPFYDQGLFFDHTSPAISFSDHFIPFDGGFDADVFSFDPLAFSHWNQFPCASLPPLNIDEKTASELDNLMKNTISMSDFFL